MFIVLVTYGKQNTVTGAKVKTFNNIDQAEQYCMNYTLLKTKKYWATARIVN